ncbi:T9SS type A sorting domain-containing protein [uncultured Kordia sp.]|uniref:T9SS type A sorting domain-containing protein n=1 Tax=uncultured Kordia sp. TaxID=507699 RepID=UPI002634A3D3|nr:T9SS type A sorting domain-containing protein [uncultured Kordia sp.]
MKKNYTCICLAACLFMSLMLSAQAEVVANTGLLNPVGVTIKDNDLFISSVGNMSIQRKDLTDTSTTATTEFLPNLSFGVYLMIQGNDLYIPMLANDKVVKIDVTNPTAVLTDVATNIIQPAGIAFRNNEMYVTSRNQSKIVKVDLSQSNPIPVDVITQIPGTLVDAVVFKGDELYFTHSGSVSKINVTDPTPTIEEVLVDVGALHIVFDGDIMYVSQSGTNTVSRVDTSQSTPIPFTFLTLPQTPWGMVLDDNNLYIAEQTGSRVVRFDLTTLGVDEASARKFTYYPNPTKDYVHIAGLAQNTSYALTDQHGREIMKGKLASVDKLDLSTVANGVYFLKLNNYEVKKIIKY